MWTSARRSMELLWRENQKHLWSYRFPVPFMGYAAALYNAVIYLVVIWFFIPKSWKDEESLKTKMKYLIVFTCLNIFMNISYESIVVVLKRCPLEYQHIFALAMPALREVRIWITMKLVQTSEHNDLTGVTIALKYGISVYHTMGLCNTIATIATEGTSWILITVDFFLNICLALRLIWLKKRHPNNIQQQINVLQELALYELVEFLVPLAFTMVLGVTYFGPNGNLYGNIRRSIWTFTAIKNINETLANTLKFFVVDFMSTIFCAAILWVLCRINLWNTLLQLQKEFGRFFIMILSWLMISVSMNYA